MNETSGRAIFIVDDEKSYVDLLAQMLSDQFSNPIHAFTRPAALIETAKSIEPGLVVTDYQMPQMDGIELIKRMRVEHPGVPFVMITGHGLRLTREELDRLPELHCVLYKPFGWRALSSEIRKAWPIHGSPLLESSNALHHPV